MYSARNNEERKEIAIRDIGSIYFYMWAQGHVGNILNFIESGKFSRLNPSSANTLNEHLNKFLDSKGGELSIEEFKKLVLGKNSSEIKLPDGIKYETAELSKFTEFMNKFKSSKSEPLQVVKVSDLEGLNIDKNIMNRIKEMSKLQPLREGVSVVTKQQIIDAYNISEINNPELLDKIFSEASQSEVKATGF